MCWGEEPLDLVMLLLKLLTGCWHDPLRFFMYLMRMYLGLILDFACAVVIYKSILQEHYPDDIPTSIWPYVGYAAVESFVWAALLILCFRVAKGNTRMLYYFLTYKAADLVLALINVAGFIVGRDAIDFQNWLQVIALVLTGCDVIVNPVQMLIAWCCSRTNSIHKDREYGQQASRHRKRKY